MIRTAFDRSTADVSERNDRIPSCIKRVEYTDQLSDRQLLKNYPTE
jgi:hypothetical protein